MASTDPTADDFEYDELAYLHENAAEAGLAIDGPPPIRRESVVVSGRRRVSALRWGAGRPEVVLLHGTAQNAHTWDTVLLALGRPALAVDLPGHGHSDWRDDRAYDPWSLAADVAEVIEELVGDSVVLVGMSLGGFTANALTARRPDLVRRLVAVDITPNPDPDAARDIHDFVSGPQAFPSFAEILERTMRFNPTRSESSLRRGIVHNAVREADGSWRWRYDRRERPPRPEGAERPDPWDDVAAIDVPTLLVRGGAHGSVVTDEGVAELLRRRPSTEVVTVEGAGHSIQGDRPVELARILDHFGWGEGGAG
jgi:pimeloyl-ACP methyl ester carboxylesterase